MKYSRWEIEGSIEEAGFQYLLSVFIGALVSIPPFHPATRTHYSYNYCVSYLGRALFEVDI